MSDIATFKTTLAQIHEIQTHKTKTTIDFENMWKITFDHFIKKKGSEIYELYTGFINGIISDFQYTNLELTLGFWSDVKTTCKMISCFISCIQEVDVPRNPGWKLLLNFALDNFNAKLWTYKTQFYNDLMTFIITDYSGGFVNKQVVHKTFGLLKELKLLKDFEPIYLGACAAWFGEWVAKNLLLSSKHEILTNSEKLLSHVETYLDQCDTFRDPMLLTTSVSVPTCAHLMSYAEEMLDGDRYKELELMYTLVKRSDTQCVEFGKIISDNIVSRCTSSDVPTLVGKNKKYMKILALFETSKSTNITTMGGCSASRNYKKMYSYFFHGFESAIEKLKMIETFAIYIDSLFLSKKLTEDEFEQIVKDTLDLAVYFRDKDVFERYYKINFGRRLLNGCQIEYERIALTVLKGLFGMSFIHSMEIMFRDIESAKEVNDAFSSKLLSVNVLTDGMWPMSALVTVPDLLQPTIDKFCEFYKKRFSNRNLKFLNYGSCEVKMNAGNKSFTLLTSTSQMCILLYLNKVPVINSEVVDFGMRKEDVDRQLLSLSHTRHPVLVKCDGGYKMNEKFTSKTFRVKIMTLAAQKENVAEQKETNQKIEQNRFLQVDAAIVRIMKTRKTLDYNNIVVEVTKALQSRFTVMPTMVKKRIESLLEREFLERDQEDSKVFNYLA